ncbi:MAG: hypothetical protein WC683_00925 [bacterium]
MSNENLTARLDRFQEDLDEMHPAAGALLREFREEHGRVLLALDEAKDVAARVVVFADEEFGPFPVQTAAEAMTAIEHGTFERRKRRDGLEAEVERLRRESAEAFAEYLDQFEEAGVCYEAKEQLEMFRAALAGKE